MMNWKLYLIIGLLLADVVTSILVFIFERELFWMIQFHWFLMFFAFILALTVISMTITMKKKR